MSASERAEMKAVVKIHLPRPGIGKQEIVVKSSWKRRILWISKLGLCHAFKRA